MTDRTLEARLDKIAIGLESVIPSEA